MSTSPKPHSLLKTIARIAKHYPENITSVVKCVKLLFPKKTKKINLKIC